MAKAKRKSALQGEPGVAGVEAPYALWGRGNVKGARALATAMLAAPAEELRDDQRQALGQLLTDTAPDPRALQIGLFALSVVVLVILLTKLFAD